MNLNKKTVVTDDGPKKQDIGSFNEQGLTINGRFRALPVLQILLMLEVAGNVSSKAIFEKLDFVQTDQSSHNLEVDKKIFLSLGAERISEHLFRNVHPPLMFNRIISKALNELENAIDRDKIYSSFLVNATSHSSLLPSNLLILHRK